MNKFPQKDVAYCAYCEHLKRNMNRSKTKNARRKGTNLSLSPESIGQLEKLRVALNRSKSNVVEVLVKDKAKELKLIAA